VAELRGHGAIFPHAMGSCRLGAGLDRGRAAFSAFWDFDVSVFWKVGILDVLESFGRIRHTKPNR
jgi:hypothetical protein